MEKTRNFNSLKIILLVIVFLINITIVNAQNVLDILFEPFYGVSVGEFYDNYALVVDAIIYFVLFLGVAKVTLGKKFTGRGGRAIIAAVGVALALSMASWARTAGFTLKSFGVMAAAILIALFAIMVFNLALGKERKIRGAAFSYVATYVTIQIVMPELFESLENVGQWGKFAIALLNLLIIIAIALLPVEISRLWRSRTYGEDYDHYGREPWERDREREYEREPWYERERRRRERHRPGPGPEPPEPGPEPGPGPGPEPVPTPPDFTQQLNEIETLLGQYETGFNNEFVPACNDVLQTHHDFMGSIGYTGSTNPPVSDAQWNRIIQSANGLGAIDQRINQLLESIRNHADFGRVDPSQNTRLVNLTSRRTQLITNMQNFYLDFLNRYRNASPPVP